MYFFSYLVLLTFVTVSKFIFHWFSVMNAIRSSWTVYYQLPGYAHNSTSNKHIWEKFQETGIVDDNCKIGHPKINEKDKLNVLLAPNNNSHNSLGKVSRKQDIPIATTEIILKLETWHTYMQVLAQNNFEDNPDRRMQFSQTLRGMCNEHPLLVKDIAFCKELSFTMIPNGRLRRSSRVKENPKRTRKHPQIINVGVNR